MTRLPGDDSNFLSKLKKNQLITRELDSQTISSTNRQLVLNILFFSIICSAVYILSVAVNIEKEGNIDRLNTV